MASSSNPASKSNGRRDSFIWIALTCFVVLAMFLFQGGSCERDSRRAPYRLQCLNNMRQVGLALANYAMNNGGRLPPAYIADKSGKPLLSWRVLILPYIERQALYEQFHLDEPWDSEHNLKLSETVPAIFRCPSSRSAPTCTDFLVITGKGMIFDGTTSLTMDEIAKGDGTEQTILLAESEDSNIRWTEPRDLPFEAMNFDSSPPVTGFSSPHSQGSNFMFCDVHGRFLSTAIDPKILRALCTPHGNEKLSDDF